MNQVEPFVVKHYWSDERPTLKGNGFDGLEIGTNAERDLLRAELSTIMASVGEALRIVTADRDELRAFAREVLESWPAGDLDGGDLQDIAVKHGLLIPETRTEPCGDGETIYCNCADYYAPDEWAEGITCYRKKECLK